MKYLMSKLIKVNIKYYLTAFLVTAVLLVPNIIFGQGPDVYNLDFVDLVKPQNFSRTITLLITMASLGLIPFFLISTTSFLRTVIVLSLMRQATGTAQSPPNSVIVSLALFITIFVMTPTWNEINEVSIQPYRQGKINQTEAIGMAIEPMRLFMLKLTREKDLELFLQFSQLKTVDSYDNVPVWVIIPSFLISELKTAFQISFLIFIPFIVIDLIVSNILLSLGMFMLSPAMISLPFKILLFVLTDGFNLIIKGLLLSFQ